MKKLLAILLAASMLLSMVACAASGEVPVEPEKEEAAAVKEEASAAKEEPAGEGTSDEETKEPVTVRLMDSPDRSKPTMKPMSASSSAGSISAMTR